MRTPGSWMKRLAFASALALSLCSAAAHAQGTPQRGGTLVMVVQPEPPTLAAYQSTSGPIGQVSTKVYEGLLEYDFNLKPDPGPRQVLDGEPRRQDHHLQAAGRREVPRRQALHQRGREVQHPGRAEEGAPARHQHLPRGRVHRYAGSAHGRVPPLRARALHADGAVGLRIADAAQARLRHRRHRQPSERQQADRHRPVQVRRMAEGPVHAVRPQSRLLEEGPALSRPDRRALHRRRRHARRDARDAARRISPASAPCCRST